MKQHIPYMSVLCLLAILVVSTTARKVAPFFDHREETLSVGVDARGTMQTVNQLKKNALLNRRRLATGDNDAHVGETEWKETWDTVKDLDIDFQYEPEKGKGKGILKKYNDGKGGKGDDDSGKGKGSKKSSKSVKKDSSSGKGKSGKGKGGKKSRKDFEPSPCDDCDDEDIAGQFEFVLVRDEIGTDADGDGDFGLASGIGLNGQVFKTVYTTSGRDFSGDAIGIFKAFCTVVSDVNGDLLCSYEIFLYTSGSNGVGGVLVTGPVAGLQSERSHTALVTGAEFDFAKFDSGTLTTVQDKDKPILFATLTFH